MIRFKHAIIPAAICLMLGAAAVPADAQTYTTVTTTTTYDSPIIVHQGMMSMGSARSRALSAVPGRVANSTLRRNDFGELVYVFDIRNGDMAHIVRVDPFTGQVVGRETVNPRSGFFDRLFAPLGSGE